MTTQLHPPSAFEHLSQIQEREVLPHIERLEDIYTGIARAIEDTRQPTTRAPLRGHWRTIALAAVLLLTVGMAAALRDRLAPEPVPSLLSEAQASRWIVVSETHPPQQVPFANGSQMILTPGSSARILQTAPHIVRVLLEKGKASIEVTHRPETDWLLEAGPYTVRVTGTRFSMSFSPEDQLFEIHLVEGSVLVFGPMLEEGKPLEAGQRIAAWIERQRIELTMQDDPVTAPASSDEPDSPPEEAPLDTGHLAPLVRTPRIPEPTTTNVPETTINTDSTWRTLCDSGEFNEVIRQARQRGLHSTMNTAAAADLMALGEAARLTRNRMMATEVYQSVRNRFAGSSKATQAAYFLGRIAFDEQRAYGVAARWFNVYLNENPTGPLSREALGRLMEAQTHIGKRDQARKNAALYLQRYPDGVHAPIAGKLLEEL